MYQDVHQYEEWNYVIDLYENGNRGLLCDIR